MISMEREEKKINKLLGFYYKEKVPISLKIKSMNNLFIKGKIIKKNIFGMKYIIIKNLEKNPIKLSTEGDVFSCICIL